MKKHVLFFSVSPRSVSKRDSCITFTPKSPFTVAKDYITYLGLILRVFVFLFAAMICLRAGPGPLPVSRISGHAVAARTHSRTKKRRQVRGAAAALARRPPEPCFRRRRRTKDTFCDRRGTDSLLPAPVTNWQGQHTLFPQPSLQLHSFRLLEIQRTCVWTDSRGGA